MEQQLFKTLPYKTIAEVTNESVSYIQARKDRTIIPLKTRWKKFNRVCCGGLEPNMILTIAGGSGSGKSAFANTLETDLIDLNTDQEIVILDFSFEMLSYRQIGRKLSNRLRRTTSELYSAEDSIDDATFTKVKEAEYISFSSFEIFGIYNFMSSEIEAFAISDIIFDSNSIVVLYS